MSTTAVYSSRPLLRTLNWPAAAMRHASFRLFASCVNVIIVWSLKPHPNKRKVALVRLKNCGTFSSSYVTPLSLDSTRMPSIRISSARHLLSPFVVPKNSLRSRRNVSNCSDLRNYMKIWCEHDSFQNRTTAVSNWKNFESLRSKMQNEMTIVESCNEKDNNFMNEWRSVMKTMHENPKIADPVAYFYLWTKTN